MYLLISEMNMSTSKGISLLLFAYLKTTRNLEGSEFNIEKLQKTVSRNAKENENYTVGCSGDSGYPNFFCAGISLCEDKEEWQSFQGVHDDQ